MSTKASLENGNTFDLAYPDGDVVDLALTDDFTRETKEAILKRMQEEHYWPDNADAGYDSTNAEEVGSTGRHLPGSGRTDLKTRTAVTNDTKLGVLSSSKKDGALIRMIDGVSSSHQMGRVLYVKKETGTLCPAIKHLRGKIWMTGAFVHQRLTTGTHNRLIGSVTFEDEEGVDDVVSNPGSEIGYDIYKPYPDVAAPSRKIWRLRCWNGNPETMVHTPNSNETFCIEVEDFGGSDKGVRLLFDRDGINFEDDLAAPSDKQFDTIEVKTHVHTGGAMGVNVPYTGINPTDALRITQTKYPATFDFSALPAIPQGNWARVAQVSAANWNENVAEAIRGISIHLHLDTTANPVMASVVTVAVGVSETNAGGLGINDSVESVVVTQLVKGALNEYRGSAYMELQAPSRGGPNKNTVLAVYLRAPAGDLGIDSGTAEIHVNSRRR